MWLTLVMPACTPSATPPAKRSDLVDTWRHDGQLERQQQAIAKCLGKHLGLSETQVKRLTSSIKTRLGSEWLAADRLAGFVN